jgi:DNA-directed RNA polymerase specialized sigma24 family protein
MARFIYLYRVRRQRPSRRPDRRPSGWLHSVAHEAAIDLALGQSDPAQPREDGTASG